MRSFGGPKHPRFGRRRHCQYGCLLPGVLLAMGARMAIGQEPAPKQPTPAQEEVITPTVEVSAPRFITLLPGVGMEREQMTTNAQSVTSEQIQSSRSVSLTDFMNTHLQSVNVADYQGNQFQQDLTFRGFSASPQIGTPQGISVYIDGIRVNEPFGEVVNWDLIPMNAIRGMDLIPGSNPLFGLNTLGGALSIQMKSGFTDPGLDASVAAGSWNSSQAQATVGANNGQLAGLVAFNVFDSDGWRDNSHSQVRQLYTNVGVMGERTEFGVSYMYADNSLTGNGMVPLQLYNQDRDAVFTSPDKMENRLNQLALNGRYDLSLQTSVSAMIYTRKVTTNSTSGDFYDEWDQAANGRTGLCPNPATSTFPNGAAEVNATGCPGVTPNGVFNYGETDQTTYGGVLQLNWLTDTRQVTVGASYDYAKITFTQDQRLGWIAPGGTVYLDPSTYATVGLVPLVQDIQRNNVTGNQQTASLFGLSTFALRPTLNLSAGARYNYTRVRNNMVSDRPIPLYQFNTATFNRLQERCGAEDGDPFARFYCTEGDYTYNSFNPYGGLSWLPTPNLNWFGSVSQGSRVPSVIELGCARDKEAEKRFAGQNNGTLQGCSIPTSLTGDPYLKQVTSTSYETGLRGQVPGYGLEWNAAVYRTDLENDIMFVSLGQRNRGVFDNFGKTRRQGFELGFTGALGQHTFRGAYAYTDATFQSPATVVNPANSSSNHAQGQLSEFTIEPGDHIPGIPAQTLRLGWEMNMAQRFTLGLTMITNSWSYARGNENNKNEPGGTSSNGSIQTDFQGNQVVDPGRDYVGSGKIPGYTIFNLNAAYKLGGGLSVFLKVDNLFDKDYQTAGELGLNPFTPSRWGYVDSAGFNYNSNDWQYTNFVGPGAPRSFWLGIAYSFSPPRPSAN